MVVSPGRSEDKQCSSLSEKSRELPQVSERELSGASSDGSAIRFPQHRESKVVQGGDPDVLDTEDQEFLMDHIRQGTKNTYSSGWHQLCDFCGERKVDPMTASPQFIVKFIRHCQKLGLTYFVLKNVISAISKYHITGDSGLTMGCHPLVRRARKAFWQNNPPLPRYRGTWDVKIILRFIEGLGENDSLSLNCSLLRQRSS